MFAQLLPTVLLYTPSYQYVFDADVKGMSPGLLLTLGSRFRDVQRWYMKTSPDSDDSR
jgi:hypothetical protein